MSPETSPERPMATVTFFVFCGLDVANDLAIDSHTIKQYETSVYFGRRPDQGIELFLSR